MVFASCLQVPMWLSFPPVGAQTLGFVSLQPLQFILGRLVPHGDSLWPTDGAQSAFFSQYLGRGSFMLLIQPSPSHVINMVDIQLWLLGRVTQPLCFYYMVGWVFFSGLCSTQWHVWLQICGWHLTWWFWCGDWVSSWWIYSNLVNRMLHCLMTHLLWFHGQGVHTYPISTWTKEWGLLPLNKAVKDFEHGLSSILMDCVDIPQLDESFDEADAMSSSVSSGFYTQLVPFLMILDCSSLLQSNLINYGAWLMHYLYVYHW